MRSNNRFNKLFNGLLAAALLGLVGCVNVQAEVPELEVTQNGIRFDGVPGGARLGEVSTTRKFTLTGDSLSFVKDLNSQVYATGVVLTPESPLADLGFIHTVQVLMSSSTGETATAPVEVLNYERPSSANGPVSKIEENTLYPIDITDVWRSEKTVITLVISGILPESSWSANLTLRLGGKIEYSM